MKGQNEKYHLRLKKLGIDTHRHAIVYIHKNSPVCQSEGFEVPLRVRVTLGEKSILATLNMVSDHLLDTTEASLSDYAWSLLNAKENDTIFLSHPKPLQSLSYVRSKVYGHTLKEPEMMHIMEDIVHGYYSDIDTAMFLTACAGGRLDQTEIVSLTKAMVNTGDHLTWPDTMIFDKHCVGGLPGNRTTLIVVPIVTAFGLTMPKTSSRAITSPAGTADTMETLAPVNLSIAAMKKVVEQEHGCIVWGGSATLSPADDILIRVERVMDIDSEGQLIASVLSKKIAAGSTHIVIDIPVGPTAKVRSLEMANQLEAAFQAVAKKLGMQLSMLISDGLQPVGRGIGPALEAKDVLAVLQNHKEAPMDLRERALVLAGKILEFSGRVKEGEGKNIAADILQSGQAWKKFVAICNAQGGMREPPTAQFTHTILSGARGRVSAIDNRQLSKLAKLAGAPEDLAAGVVLHTPLDAMVEANQPLFTVHAESKGLLNYALSLLDQIPPIVVVESCE